jgi:putative copper export protein
MDDVIAVLMRWLHISSVATLIGGMIFGRVAMSRAAEALSPDSRESLMDSAALLYRPLVFAAMGGLLVSGTYNIIMKVGHTPPLYHVLLGIKLLLVLHVFAVAILISRPHNPRRARMMAGAAISGLAIIAISACLPHLR